MLMDWVPGHFPKDDWALAKFDGEPLYEHPDPRRGEQNWGTYVFDYGNPRVRNFLVANALFWLEEMHIDGLRVDAVASMLYLDYSREDGEWLPNIHGGREHLEAIGFLQEATATVQAQPRHRDDRRGVHVVAGRHRAHVVGRARLRLQVEHGLDARHAAVVHPEGPDVPGAPPPRPHVLVPLRSASTSCCRSATTRSCTARGRSCARCRATTGSSSRTCAPTLAYMWAHPGKQLLFMGQEFGQLSEWSEARPRLVDPRPADAQAARRVRRGAEPHLPRDAALWQLDDDSSGFEWVEGGAAAENVIAFLRYDRERRPLLCVVNFAGRPHEGFRLGLPRRPLARGAELGCREFGGSGVGNLGGVDATDDPWSGRPASGVFTPPPLYAVDLRSRREPRRGRSVEQVGEAASGRHHLRVVDADDLEQLDEPRARCACRRRRASGTA